MGLWGMMWKDDMKEREVWIGVEKIGEEDDDGMLLYWERVWDLMGLGE